MRRLLAEGIGTFVLVLAGTGAIVVDSSLPGMIGHVGVALCFGLVVLAMIQTFGDVSGAHLNPAVTVGFVVAKRFPLRSSWSYILAQCSGAILASGCLRLLFPGDATLGATLPSGAVLQSLALEIVMTWILMLVILSVSAGSKERGLMAGIAIGAVVGLEALFGGPISGASMNPARSIGPALVSGHLDDLWIYLVAPIAGALLAVPTCRLVQAPGCCGQAEGEGACP
ncbi:MAG: MIP/aquaporin family protein [Planctomycetota bacterium]